MRGGVNIVYSDKVRQGSVPGVVCTRTRVAPAWVGGAVLALGHGERLKRLAGKRAAVQARREAEQRVKRETDLLALTADGIIPGT